MQDKRKVDICQYRFDSAKETLAVSTNVYAVAHLLCTLEVQNSIFTRPADSDSVISRFESL